MEYEDFSLNVKICLELALSKKLAQRENRAYKGLSILNIKKRLIKRGVKTTEEELEERINWLEIYSTVIRKDEKICDLSSSDLTIYSDLVSKFLDG